MLSQSRSTSRRSSHFGAFVIPLCLLLSACGGDSGGSVASIPAPPPTPTPTPPPTPTPTPTPTPGADTYPATRVGAYDLLGSTPNPGAALSDFQLTVLRPSVDGDYRYKLTGPKAFLPVGAPSSVEFGPDALWSTDADGLLGASYTRLLPFSANEQLRTGLNLKPGYSYVSMGSWEWALVYLDGGTSGDGYGELVFVIGDRTPRDGIPVSGTATYGAKTNLGSVTGPFTLTADFLQRTVSTKIEQDYRYNPAGDLMDYPLAAGIHVEGSAPFSNDGDFDIPLAGTVNYVPGYPSNTTTTPASRSVTGDMNGAFFGPHAEQVGGTYSLSGSTGVQILQDAFVGQQNHP